MASSIHRGIRRRSVSICDVNLSPPYGDRSEQFADGALTASLIPVGRHRSNEGHYGYYEFGAEGGRATFA